MPKKQPKPKSQKKSAENKKLSNKLTSNRNLFLILITIIMLLSYLYIRPFSARVRDTIPADNQQYVSQTDPLVISFNKNLPATKQSDVRINIYPQVDGNLVFTSDQTAEYQTETDFQPNTKYTVSIFGPGIVNHQFTFTTGEPIDFESIIESNKAKHQTADDPVSEFIRSLPYRYEDKIHIRYISLSDEVFITFYDTNYDELRDLALAHIKAFGIPDPENQLNIQYRVPKAIDPNMIPKFTE